MPARPATRPLAARALPGRARARSRLALLLAAALAAACAPDEPAAPGVPSGPSTSSEPSAPAQPSAPSVPGDPSAPSPAAGASSAPAAAPADAVRSFSCRAMGGLFELAVVPGDADELEAAVEAAFAAVRRLEALVNLWSPDSALARFDAAAAEGTRALAREPADLLERALAWCAESGGAFDPTVALPLRELGFYGGTPVADLDALAPEREARWRRLVGCGRVRVLSPVTPDAPTRVVELPAGVEVDLSGLAKGRAAELALAVLRRRGVPSARLAAGPSTVAAYGPGPDGRGWPLALPAFPPPAFAFLRDEAAASSGRTSITYPSGGRERSHILDPRTLRPVAHRTEMVTVLGADPVECDLASTALLVLGADAAAAWMAARPEWSAAHTVVTWSVPREEDAPPDVRVLGGRLADPPRPLPR